MPSMNFLKVLRSKAQEKLNNDPQDVSTMDRLSVNRLVEELQIHKIELEIQNEELRNVQSKLEAGKKRYVSLFNNAPMGYVILNKNGIIKQVNRSFETMVFTKVEDLLGQPFADLLLPSYESVFRAKFNALFKHPEGKVAEYALEDKNGKKHYLQIRANGHDEVFDHVNSDEEELLLMVSDITELKEALDDVRQLNGLLPICSHCKKIRDDKGYWNQLEVYIQKHSDATFSHGICQECAKELYPDLDL